MDEKEMAWWGNSTPGSMYGLPPPFVPGADSWGAPPMPPPNSSMGGEGWNGPMFGGPPPVMPTHQMQMGPGYPGQGGPCWNPGNMFEVPPPQHQGGMQQMRGGRGGGPPRGGRGFMRPCPNPGAVTFNHFESNRGGRPGRGGRGGMTGGRGGYTPAGNGGGDHTKEKTDGRQSAIAETIAMMKKMQMEDKERKEAAKEKEEKRKAMNPDSGDAADNQDEDEVPVDGPAPPRRHGYQARENAQPRGRGAKRGGGAKNRGGGKNGQKGTEVPQSSVAGGSLPVGPGNQFAVPPGAPGGEGFNSFQGMNYHLMGMPSGSSEFNGFPNNNGYPYAPQIPDQFNPGFKNYAMGQHSNQMPPEFGGPQSNGQFIPQQRIPRQNDQGFGRGGGQRGRGGASNRRQRGYEPENEPVVRWDQGVDVFDNGHGPIANGQNDQPAKNLNSEQGTPKGQLALLASNGSLSTSTNNNSNRKKKPVDKNLRERLIQQLVSGQSECMICFEKVKQQQATWDCKQCYQIFHIFCIKKWSRSQMALADTDSGGWRCPGCQSVTKSSPNYVCFCGKTPEPAYNRNEIPHSCGEVCGREKKIMYPGCTHRCIILCHPGPCPPCTASVTRTCPCGKTKKSVKCGNPVGCTETCDKPLSCGEHKCKSLCHEGSCDECDVIHQQTCFCPRNKSREIQCGKVDQEEVKIGGFSCQEECQKVIECGNHKCSQPCHSGDCGRCERDVSLVSRCPCGKKSLSEMGVRRNSCLDDIPSCGSMCGKKLSCGQVGKNHVCQSKCHTGPCPPCSLTTKVLCRCGAMDKELECTSLTSRADDALCEKRCSKKRNCGKHKCGAKCCIDPNHICAIVCGKTLSCGLHRCAETCHFGNCAVCTNVSFDELRCYCGSKVIYPPIACGTKPPPCSEPCRRAHSCTHEVRHTCHSEAQCPPCAALTEKWCHGKHELRKNVPCHLESIFCGRPCGLALPCGRHQCIKPCHQGSCLNEAKQEKCSQPCVQVRSSCGHPCNAPCHDGSCPNTPCNEKVKLNCACGNLSATVMCSKNESEYRRLHTALLASKMSNIQYGSGSTTIELNDLWPATSVTKSGSSRKQVLECNEECAKLERNRRLSLALQIENPELSSKLTAPKFSEFLKEFSRKEPAFSQNVHDKLTELVKLAKESKQKSRSHSFPCMNREKRQFIHEYSDHFGVTTESFDCEPNRNVVATAMKDKSWLPSQSINEVVQNLRKALGPVTLTSKNNGSVSGILTALQPIPKTAKGAVASASEEPAKKLSAPVVDYFDD